MDSGSSRLLDGRYRLGPLVGRGGMAAVHAATDTKLRRAVAVKLFHLPADEIALARLESEARLLAGMSHPGLVKAFDVGISADRPYLVMQLVSGGTLRALLNRGPLEPAEVARIGARLADTLRYVHSRLVVHRDIKPSNVLLDGAGEVYLADFGIAKAAGAARLTGSGNCVGTAAYLAPEQVSGKPAGPPADLYSLALVLLECLTGRPEFPGSDVEAAVARLGRSPRIPPSVPPALGQALTMMLSRDPSDRPTAGAAAAMFENFLAEPAGSAVLSPTKVYELEPLPRGRWMYAASALAVLSVAVTVILLSGTGTPPARQAPAGEAGAPVGAVQQQETAVSKVDVAPAPKQPEPRSGKGKGKSGKHGRGGE